MSVSIDTEEDNWGSYTVSGATATNIDCLPELQEIFGRWGVRPTYLVNSAVLGESRAVEVLRSLAEREDVEIGTHCHPWNTPPLREGGQDDSMMCRASVELNRARIAYTTERIRDLLGTDPKCFRAGRWGFGPTVAEALLDLGYLIDSSVSPMIDWSPQSGPDFSFAPRAPYRFRPDAVLVPCDDGPLVELPTTVGFFRGDQDRMQRLRHRLERSLLARMKVVGVLDVAGLLRKRWLSPETTRRAELVSLSEACVRDGEPHLALTFHSVTLLAGATPFVPDAAARTRFLERLEHFFRHCSERGFRFATLSEVAGQTLGVPI